MKRVHYWQHLLHRRCRWCWSNGHTAGYQAGHAAAAREAAERERIWREVGVDPDKLEEFIRRRAA